MSTRHRPEADLAPSLPPPRLLPSIGAHVSAAGGLMNAVKKARSISAEIIQIFPSNPRMWRPAAHSAEDVQAFAQALRRDGLPLFLHAIYLINLASPDPALRRRSAGALAETFRFACAVEARGVVVHVGSHHGDGFETALPRVVETVAEARAALEDDPVLLVESSAGGGNSVGGSLWELSRLVEALPGPTGICLDTAHLFAAGHPLHTPAGLDALVDSLVVLGLLPTLGLIHLNDCSTALGSHHDRHANLWEGRLGRAGLQLALGHPAFRQTPFVLEVPGADGHGPDRRNVRRARQMRRETAVGGQPA
jgi:deoxyribonuclease IV